MEGKPQEEIPREEISMATMEEKLGTGAEDLTVEEDPRQEEEEEEVEEAEDHHPQEEEEIPMDPLMEECHSEDQMEEAEDHHPQEEGEDPQQEEDDQED